MSVRPEVVVFLLQARYSLVLPSDMAGELMVQFKQEFPIEHGDDGITSFNIVASDPALSGRWHVQISVTDPQKFFKFLRDFCQEKGLALRLPETFEQPHQNERRAH